MIKVLENEIELTGYGISLDVEGENLYSKKSEFQQVDIFKSKTLGNVLTLDGLMMTTVEDEFFYHEMIAHIPLCSHKNPENVLVIGGGDGGTVREVLKHPSVKNVDLCEIDALVIEASKMFLPSIAGKLDDKRVNIYVEDAIEFIKTKKNCYDVVLVDSTDPMGPGVGLFTEEFYTNVKESLKKGGIVTPQSESPFANKNEMKNMYILLKKVFKTVLPYCGPIPTYPGGYWSWAFCSDDNDNTIKDTKRAELIEKDAKLYNTKLHNAVFAVPNFVRKIVDNE
ncbi:TPA: polyamine aminopropyltransferase [Candidatus Galligastranaerophilus gallistercoris]|nr:polyamine aminopropyltransferase [Candidatus Galligastranaerophilus gallistercoris]